MASSNKKNLLFKSNVSLSVHTLRRYQGEWRYSFLVLNLGTRWERLASFTLGPMYLCENSSWCQMTMRLDGSQSRSASFGGDIDLLFLSGRESPPHGHRELALMFVNIDYPILTTVGPCFGCLRAGLLCDSSLFLKWTENQPVFRLVRKIAKERDQKFSRVCLSVYTQGSNRLPLDGFSLSLIFDYFSKICRENASFVKIWQE